MSRKGIPVHKYAMNRTIQAKAIIAGVLLLLPAVFGHADSPLTVRHLASEQNIITLNVQKRFLLLPIQDNAPEGRVTIVIGNRQAGTKWMDWGKDHYATVTFSNAPEGRCIALGWMSNWQYQGVLPTEQYRGANTIARDLSLYRKDGDIFLKCAPSREIEKARKIDMKLSNAKGENIHMYYDMLRGQFVMDRSNSGEAGFSQDFPAVTIAPAEPYDSMSFVSDRGSFTVKSMKIYRLD